MDKKDILKILAVVIVIGFMAELFFLGGPSIFFGGGGSGTNQSGSSIFSGTVRTYDPLLVVPLNTSASVIEQVRSRPDVKNVKADTQGYVIDVETRDDVYAIGSFLKSLNVSSLTIANVAVTDEIEVTTVAGTVKAQVPGGVIRVVMEPLVESGSEVTVSMVAIVRNGVLVDYGSAAPAVTQSSFLVDAYIESSGNKTYEFTIPWEERNSVDLSNYSDYKKIDSIVFTTPLDVNKIVEKRQIFYVTFIDSTSAQVSSDFDDLTQLTINFQDVQYALPPSKLIVVSESAPMLPYNYTVDYSYMLRLNDSRIDPSLSLLDIKSQREFQVNESLKVNVTALSMGNKIISITRAALPS
jgi:hypothetical protein